MSGKYTSRIDIYLKANGLSWTSLVEPLDVDRKTISNWKKRDNYPVQALETIAKLVGISVSELTDVEGEFDTMRRLMGELEKLRSTLNNELGDIRRKV